MNDTPIAVLLMAYGAAATLEDIPAYLKDIRGGREASPELIADVRRRYHEMGGRSPLIGITQAQAAALESELRRRNIAANVSIGMRHSPPTIDSAVLEIKAKRFSKIVALPMTPYYSSLSVGAYRQKFEQAVRDAGIAPETLFVDSWSGHPKFVDSWAKKLAQTLSQFPPDQRNDVETIFSAHSLPQKILQEKDPYPDTLRAAAAAIAKKAGLRSWQFAYQSRGQTSDVWLGPDVAEVIEALSARSLKNVMVAPIGFVSDHMETLYDDDILYRRLAEQKGMTFKRVPSPNADPLFIEAIADVIIARITSSAAGGKRQDDGRAP